MQSLVGVAGCRLASSTLCSSKPHSPSIAQPETLVRSLRVGLRAWILRRRSRSLVASGYWSSSKQNAYRGVVSEDIEGIPVGEYGERYLVPNTAEDGDDYGLGDVKLECDSNGCIIVMPESRSLSDKDVRGSYLRCDLTGCYFTREAPATKSFDVIEGDGWRLGYETAPESASSFCAIVGAGGWSVALTGGEFDDFCTLIQSIRKGIINMNEDEMTGRNDIVLQVEKGSIWMECSIPKARVGALKLLWQPGVPRHMIDSQLKQAFEVRFVLSGGASKRQAEGYWPADAVMDMLNKVDATSFNQPEAPFAENVPRAARPKF